MEYSKRHIRELVEVVAYSFYRALLDGSVDLRQVLVDLVEQLQWDAAVAFGRQQLADQFHRIQQVLYTATSTVIDSTPVRRVCVKIPYEITQTSRGNAIWAGQLRVSHPTIRMTHNVSSCKRPTSEYT